jgi:hypothetical protein
MRTEEKKISLYRQLVICAALCGLAIGVILLFHHEPYVPPLLAGLTLPFQALVGLTIGGLFWAASSIGYKRTANYKSTQSTIESYSRVDIEGW